ncbi:MAG: hypothetical protein KBC33_02420 [Candidatus Pacebacteria bacterium]|nr:hypothetical protein [Candidatus Paceibacterota bacterium]
MSTEHKWKVAFANDSSFFSKIRVNILQGLGFEVVMCTNADEVMQCFGPRTQEPCRMLVTDAHLAHSEELVSRAETNDCTETGLVLYKKLRAANRTLPIVLYVTDRQLFREAESIHDPYFAVVYDCDEGATMAIVEIVQKSFARKV